MADCPLTAVSLPSTEALPEGLSQLERVYSKSTPAARSAACVQDFGSERNQPCLLAFFLISVKVQAIAENFLPHQVGKTNQKKKKVSDIVEKAQIVVEAAAQKQQKPAADGNMRAVSPQTQNITTSQTNQSR